MDAQQIGDALTTIGQRLAEFKEELRDKARKRQRYFVKRGLLVGTLQLTRTANAIPADASPDSPPEGTDPGQWRRLVKLLQDAEKVLRDEAQKVPAGQAPPAPLPPVTVSGSTPYKRRDKARDALKKELISIYGEERGKFWYQWHEKYKARRPDSARLLRSQHADLTVFFPGGVMPEPTGTATDGGSTSTAPRLPAGGLRLLAPMRRITAPAAPSRGLLARLWPTDQPVYKRPGAIVGAASVLAIVGYIVLRPKSEKPKSEKAKE
jgi:hypothetical protein